MIFKRLFILAAFAFVHISFAKGYWIPIYTQPDNSDTFLMDNQGIRIENFGSGTRLVYVDVLVNKFQPYMNNGQAVNSMTTTYSYNCFNRMILVGDVVMRSGSNGSGSQVAVHRSSGEWREVRSPGPTPAIVSRIKNYCN
jgi:hypothetical protein